MPDTADQLFLAASSLPPEARVLNWPWLPSAPRPHYGASSCCRMCAATCSDASLRALLPLPASRRFGDHLRCHAHQPATWLLAGAASAMKRPRQSPDERKAGRTARRADQIGSRRMVNAALLAPGVIKSVLMPKLSAIGSHAQDERPSRPCFQQRVYHHPRAE